MSLFMLTLRQFLGEIGSSSDRFGDVVTRLSPGSDTLSRLEGCSSQGGDAVKEEYQRVVLLSRGSTAASGARMF